MEGALLAQNTAKATAMMGLKVAPHSTSFESRNTKGKKKKLQKSVLDISLPHTLPIHTD